MKSLTLTAVLALSAFVYAQDGGKKDEPAPKPVPAPQKPEKPEQPEKPKEPEKPKDAEAPKVLPNPLALIKTSMGDIKVVLYVNEAPKTVANFLELAAGKKEWTDTTTKEKVTRPFFDGLIFHRCIKKFMIQGGCPLGTGTGSPGYKFDNEISARGLGLDKMKALEGGRPHGFLQVRTQAQFNGIVIRPLLKKWGIKSPEDFEKRKDEIQKKLQEIVPKLTIKDIYANQGFKFDDSREAHHPLRGCLAMANSGPGTNGSQFFINVVDTPWLAGKHTVFGGVVEGMDIVDKISNVEVGAGARPVEAVRIISVRAAGFEKPKAKTAEAPDAPATPDAPKKPDAPKETDKPEKKATKEDG